MNVTNLTEFREKVGRFLPAVPKNYPPQEHLSTPCRGNHRSCCVHAGLPFPINEYNFRHVILDFYQEVYFFQGKTCHRHDRGKAILIFWGNKTIIVYGCTGYPAFFYIRISGFIIRISG